MQWRRNLQRSGIYGKEIGVGPDIEKRGGSCCSVDSDGGGGETRKIRDDCVGEKNGGWYRKSDNGGCGDGGGRGGDGGDGNGGDDKNGVEGICGLYEEE